MKCLNKTGMFFAVAAILSACGGSPKTVEGSLENVDNTGSAERSHEAQATTSETTEEVNFVERELNDEEVHEFGLVNKIEDAGYPFFNLTIEFPERGFEMPFMVNVEEVEKNFSDIQEMQGNYATIYYDFNETYDLMDLHRNDQSIWGGNDPVEEDWISAGGLLSGATELSGDTPSDLSFKDWNGNEYHFQYFVTQEMIDNSPEELTAFFRENTVNRITYMKMSKD